MSIFLKDMVVGVKAGKPDLAGLRTGANSTKCFTVTPPVVRALLLIFVDNNVARGLYIISRLALAVSRVLTGVRSAR